THLGKNGDQIDRLFSEPADIIVLQHSHEVPAGIHRMMEAYAHDVRNPRYYSILDGQDTWRILNGHGHIRRNRIRRRDKRIASRSGITSRWKTSCSTSG